MIAYSKRQQVLMQMEKNLLAKKRRKKLLKMFSKIIPMPNGAIPVILSQATGLCRNGHSPERSRMEVRWKSQVVIFLLLGTKKFISKTLTEKIGRQFLKTDLAYFHAVVSA